MRSGWIALALAAAVGACLSPGDVPCADGSACPAGRVCLDQGRGCALPEALEACADAAEGATCALPDVGAGTCDRGVCVVAVCGDAKVEGRERCDDGNLQSGDGCRGDCASEETCGNGDVDVAAGELCDDGNTTSGDGCQATCQLPRCGDLVVDDGEVCDDGAQLEGDGCSPLCELEACGNGVRDALEQCDLGAANSDAPDSACRLTCARPRCGDGIIDPGAGETCDAGAANAASPDAACRPSCQPARCGDGIVDVLAGEACDDGNTLSLDGCAFDCRSDETCGNGVPDYLLFEACDDGNSRAHDGCTRACTTETPAVTAVPQGGLGPRRIAQLVYDASRARVVLIGADLLSPGIAQTDVWEWDGAGWHRRFRGLTPSAREQVAVAYDGHRRKVVMFGGAPVSTFSPLAETWEWDGHLGTWTNRLPAAQATSVQGAAMAYDAARRHVVLFGGARFAQPESDETWVWDGAAGTWTEVNVEALAVRPPARSWHRMAYEHDRGVVVMYGGFGLEHVWEWDGATATWAERVSLDEQPPALVGGALFWDGTLSQTVMAGGFSGSGTRTWRWRGDLSEWQRSLTNPAPPNTIELSSAYDPHRGGVAAGGNITDDGATWAWRSATSTWKKVAPTAADAPGGRYGHVMVYDARRARQVVFGGLDTSGTPLGDVWEWDSMSRTWSAPTPVGPTPAPRRGMAATYDPARGCVVAFGGSTGAAELWEWHGVSSTWIERTFVDGPAGRTDGAMFYDAARGEVILYGGRVGAAVASDTWAWDGEAGTWTELTPALSPVANSSHVAVYDDVRQRGLAIVGDQAWEWDGLAETWTAQPGGVIGRNYQTRLAYDAGRARVVMLGGEGSDDSYNEDVHEWDAAIGTWRRVPLGLPDRIDHGLLYDPILAAVVAYGGRDRAFAALASHAQYQFTAPGHVDETCTGLADADGDGLRGCADDDCVGLCAPLCPPGAPCFAAGTRCGDGTCESPREDGARCPSDCAPATAACGDGACTGAEDLDACPEDCAACGDYLCSATESAATCAVDCA